MSLLGSRQSANRNAAPVADVVFPADATDTISAIRWSPTASCLAAASWDGKVRVYNVANSAAISAVSVMAAQGPVLSCDFNKDGNIVAGGGAEKKIYLLDAASGNTMAFAAHESPISAVRFVNIPSSPAPILATGSWDATVRYWDLRNTSQPLSTLQCGERVYSMDSAGPLLAIATADFNVHQVNLRSNPAAIDSTVPTKLTHQTRFVTAAVDGSRWAVGSIEGRCSAVSMDENEAKRFNFTWKCHREPDPIRTRLTKVYTVNSGAFSPQSKNILATGGSDGDVNIWNLSAHQRAEHLPRPGGNPITAVAFNSDGRLLAYAAGYDWSKGCGENVAGRYPTQLALHLVPDNLTAKK